MLDGIELPNLTAFSQPEWNDGGSVSMALRSVLSASDEESSSAAYHQLLYAVGNDHAGTYYSVALAILPTLARILREGGPWSQQTILEVLVELYGAFKPQPGHEFYAGVPLEKLIKQGISDLAPLVSTLKNEPRVTSRSARELIELIRGVPQ